MDISNSLNLNTAPQNPLFNPTYLNLEYIFSRILHFFENLFGFSGGFSTLGFYFKIILAVFAIFFIFVITYCTVRLFEIRKKEKAHLEHEIEEYAHKHTHTEEPTRELDSVTKKWNTVLQHLLSPNEADWKLAIIEADTMLEALVDQLGYQGENLGEKLKTVNKDNFRSLPMAWEAHIVRNRIAHEGLEFKLPQREAKRVMALFETVFREFDYI